MVDIYTLKFQRKKTAMLGTDFDWTVFFGCLIMVVLLYKLP